MIARHVFHGAETIIPMLLNLLCSPFLCPFFWVVHLHCQLSKTSICFLWKYILFVMHLCQVNSFMLSTVITGSVAVVTFPWNFLAQLFGWSILQPVSAKWQKDLLLSLFFAANLGNLGSDEVVIQEQQCHLTACRGEAGSGYIFYWHSHGGLWVQSSLVDKINTVQLFVKRSSNSTAIEKCVMLSFLMVGLSLDEWTSLSFVCCIYEIFIFCYIWMVLFVCLFTVCLILGHMRFWQSYMFVIFEHLARVFYISKTYI